jgi:predicted GH43/DUF377 family glycosyl hydrolase
VTWARPFQVLRPSGPFADLDRHRAERPSVIEEGSVMRMWYAGHDGSIARILAAEQRPRDNWRRLGPSVEPGLAGATDAAGVHSPSVVRRDDGYLMVYAGSDGTTTRLHLAASDDGRQWRSGGVLPAPSGHEAATAPCLITALDRLWLYYVGAGEDGRATVFAATTADGASWDDAGPVLAADGDDEVVSDPWVVVGEGGFVMFLVGRDPDGGTAVQVATSPDGRTWSRRSAPLGLSRRHYDGGLIGGPSAMRLRGGHLRLWYSAGVEGDETGGCRLWSSDSHGRTP